MVNRDWLARVPASLLLLYRQAKLFSMLCGLAALLAITATLRLLFRGRDGWWIVLAGAAPVILLPQFLYYQTLCNNDALVNALGALAIFCFTAGVRALQAGRGRRFGWWSAGCAACVGAGILTKMTAMALVLLPVAAAAALFLRDRGMPAPARWRRALLFLALLAGIVFAAGGWWLAYQASLGDWSATAAHRLAHPWGFRMSQNALTPNRFAREMVLAVRSYFALFSGPLIGIPDWAFAAYLALPLLLLAFAARGIVVGLAGIIRRPLPPGRGRLPRLLWLTLAATFLLNVALFLLNNIDSVTPHGRLFFVTSAASHALFALVLARGIRNARWRPPIALALTAALLGLFTWTFAFRLSWAVDPPRENLVLLAPGVGQMTLGPIWSAPVDQPLRLPRGRLRGFRASLKRTNELPQFGARIEGELFLSPSGRAVALPPVPIGDNDGSMRWVDLPLAEPVDLAGETQGFLRLRGRAPWFVIGSIAVDYQMTPVTPETPRVGALQGAGAPPGYTLCLSAVYDRATR
jgi:hypothetical protein